MAWRRSGVRIPIAPPLWGLIATLDQIHAVEQDLQARSISKAVSRWGGGPADVLALCGGAGVGFVALGAVAVGLDGLDGVEEGEGLPELVVGDFFFLDVDLLEDCLVEHAALVVVAAEVQGLGVFEEFEAELDEAGTVGEVFVDGGEAVA
jgi:hypothetical protein